MSLGPAFVKLASSQANPLGSNLDFTVNTRQVAAQPLRANEDLNIDLVDFNKLAAAIPLVRELLVEPPKINSLPVVSPDLKVSVGTFSNTMSNSFQSFKNGYAPRDVISSETVESIDPVQTSQVDGSTPSDSTVGNQLGNNSDPNNTSGRVSGRPLVHPPKPIGKFNPSRLLPPNRARELLQEARDNTIFPVLGVPTTDPVDCSKSTAAFPNVRDLPQGSCQTTSLPIVSFDEKTSIGPFSGSNSVSLKNFQGVGSTAPRAATGSRRSPEEGDVEFSDIDTSEPSDLMDDNQLEDIDSFLVNSDTPLKDVKTMTLGQTGSGVSKPAGPFRPNSFSYRESFEGRDEPKSSQLGVLSGQFNPLAYLTSLFGRSEDLEQIQKDISTGRRSDVSKTSSLPIGRFDPSRWRNSFGRRELLGSRDETKPPLLGVLSGQLSPLAYLKAFFHRSEDLVAEEVTSSGISIPQLAGRSSLDDPNKPHLLGILAQEFSPAAFAKGFPREENLDTILAKSLLGLRDSLVQPDSTAKVADPNDPNISTLAGVASQPFSGFRFEKHFSREEAKTNNERGTAYDALISAILDMSSPTSGTEDSLAQIRRNIITEFIPDIINALNQHGLGPNLERLD